MTEEPEPADGTVEADDERDDDRKPKRKRSGSIGQSIGGVLFGFEQHVFRNLPPAHELVHHARPDAPVPTGDGGFMTIELPIDADEPASGAGADRAPDRDELRGGRQPESRGEGEGSEDRGPEVDRVDVPDGDVDPDPGAEPWC